MGMNTFSLSTQELFSFIDRAGQATYAGGGKRLPNPERPGFIELEHVEGDWYYRDSYVGFYRSRGMEVVRYQNVPVWTSAYGGGMMDGNDRLAEETFGFLKQSLSQDTGAFLSFRGPQEFSNAEWRYNYRQEGDVVEFNGHEEIYQNNKLVFFHKIIGGLVKGN